MSYQQQNETTNNNNNNNDDGVPDINTVEFALAGETQLFDSGSNIDSANDNINNNGCDEDGNGNDNNDDGEDGDLKVAAKKGTVADADADEPNQHNQAPLPLGGDGSNNNNNAAQGGKTSTNNGTDTEVDIAGLLQKQNDLVSKLHSGKRRRISRATNEDRTGMVVQQLDRYTMEVLDEFDTPTQAAIATGVTSSAIYKATNGQRSGAGLYKFRYAFPGTGIRARSNPNSKRLPNRRSQARDFTRVVQRICRASGRVMSEHATIQEAADAVDISYNSIYSALKGISAHAGGYRWEHRNLSQAEIKSIQQRKSQKIRLQQTLPTETTRKGGNNESRPPEDHEEAPLQQQESENAAKASPTGGQEQLPQMVFTTPAAIAEAEAINIGLMKTKALEEKLKVVDRVLATVAADDPATKAMLNEKRRKIITELATGL